MKIFAGYGSTKDISVYTAIGLPPTQIYIVGRPSKKMQHQCQVPYVNVMYNSGNNGNAVRFFDTIVSNTSFN